VDGALRESYRFCHQVARREARNFYYSFLLLPPERRRSMCALYAFMRRTDDLADCDAPADAKRSRLDAWRAGLDPAHGLASAPDWPGRLALLDTVSRHEIPPRYLHEVIDGVVRDIEPQPFATFDALYRYCYLVASTVGLCCIHIWGFRSEGGRAEWLAERCGVALQLTNIVRDVREDALSGRVYLPQEELARFGVRPEDLTAGTPSDALRRLLRFQGERAYGYYAEASPLVELISPVGRPVLRTIVGIYRALLDRMAGQNYEVLRRRVSLSPLHKTAIMVRSLVSS
jgi:phytoene synthase